MTWHRFQLPAGFEIPDSNGGISAARDEVNAVRQYNRTLHKYVSREMSHRLPAAKVPNRLLPHEESTVWAEGQPVGIFLEAERLLALGNVQQANAMIVSAHRQEPAVRRIAHCICARCLAR